MSLPIEQIMQMLLNRKRPGAGGDGDGNIEDYKPLNYNYNDLLPLIQGNIENNIPLGTLKILQNIRNEMLQMPEYNIPFEPFKIHKEVGLNINPYQPIQPIITGEEPTEEEVNRGIGGKTPLYYDNAGELKTFGGTGIHVHPIDKEPSSTDLNLSNKLTNYDYTLDPTFINLYDKTGVRKKWNWEGIKVYENTPQWENVIKSPEERNIIDIMNLPKEESMYQYITKIMQNVQNKKEKVKPKPNYSSYQNEFLYEEPYQ
jgi:hypothetical protein